MMTNELLLQKIGLVVDRLMNLGGSDYEKDKTVVQADTRVGIVQRDFGIEEWDWPQGVGLYGLYKLQNYYGDTRYMEFFRIGFPVIWRRDCLPKISIRQLLICLWCCFWISLSLPANWKSYAGSMRIGSFMSCPKPKKAASSIRSLPSATGMAFTCTMDSYGLIRSLWRFCF